MSGLSKPTLICLWFAVVGCRVQKEHASQQVQSPQKMVWRASTENGDKPGAGIELLVFEAEIQAKFYLLDTDKPHDFSAGVSIPAKLKSRNTSELRLVATFGQAQVEELVVKLYGELKGTEVLGGFCTVADAQEGVEPVPLRFVRQE